MEMARAAGAANARTHAAFSTARSWCRPLPSRRSRCAARASAACGGGEAGEHRPAGRRAVLGGGAAALLLAPAAVALISGAAAPAARAAVTLKIQSRTKLRPAQMKGGYLLQIPDSYSVAYDRSDSADPTQFFAGNFRTFETVSISRFPLADLGLQQLEGVDDGSLGGLTLDEVVDKLLADTRENQSTFGFKVLAMRPRPNAAEEAPGDAATAGPDSSSGGGGTGGSSGGGSGSSPAVPYWDMEYVHQICRGITSEESGGRRRCAAVSGDRDLQVVSRHYVAAFTFRGPYLYFVKGSAPTEEWPGAAAMLLASVQSFGLPPRAAGRA